MDSRELVFRCARMLSEDLGLRDDAFAIVRSTSALERYQRASDAATSCRVVAISAAHGGYLGQAKLAHSVLEECEKLAACSWEESHAESIA